MDDGYLISQRRSIREGLKAPKVAQDLDRKVKMGHFGIGDGKGVE
jgi:hypothetical protein